MTYADQRIAALATGQLGAFTRAQAVDAGLSDRQLRSRVQSGILIQTGPNSFRFAGTPRSLRDELFDLVLDVGPPVWVTGPTLAALYGWDGYGLRRPFHLVVPRERAVSRTNARIARRGGLKPIDVTELGGLPVLTPARGLIELARYAGSAQLAAAIDSAISDGQIVERALHERIVSLRTQGRYGLPLLAEVLAGAEVTRGGNSWLEREFLRLLDEALLPRPEMQQVLSRTQDHLVRVDCRFPGTNVVVELLGYRWHRTNQQMSRDAARANALIADGFRPFQFTYAHVVSEPSYVVETTRRALALRLPADPSRASPQTGRSILWKQTWPTTACSLPQSRSAHTAEGKPTNNGMFASTKQARGPQPFVNSWACAGGGGGSRRTLGACCSARRPR